MQKLNNKRAYLFFGLGLSVLASLVCVAFFIPTRAFAASLCSPSFPPQIPAGQTANVSFDLSNVPSDQKNYCGDNPNNKYCFVIVGCNTGLSGTYGCDASSTFNVPNQHLDGNNLVASDVRNSGLTFWLEDWDPTTGGIIKYQQRACGSTEWNVAVPSQVASCDAGTFSVTGKDAQGNNIANYTFLDNLTLNFDGSKTNGFSPGGIFKLLITQNSGVVNNLGNVLVPVGDDRLHYQGTSAVNLNSALNANVDLGKLGVGEYEVQVTDANGGKYSYCSYPFAVSDDGNNQVTPTSSNLTYNLCNQVVNADEKIACCTCSTGNSVCGQGLPTGAIWTAVGCIKTDPKSIIASIMQIGLSIAGGIALLMILAAAFLFTTSQGDPKRTGEAKELLTAAVIGLLFVIFSVTILQFIGVTILQIPNFGV